MRSSGHGYGRVVRNQEAHRGRGLSTDALQERSEEARQVSAAPAAQLAKHRSRFETVSSGPRCGAFFCSCQEPPAGGSLDTVGRNELCRRLEGGQDLSGEEETGERGLGTPRERKL